MPADSQNNADICIAQIEDTKYVVSELVTDYYLAILRISASDDNCDQLSYQHKG